MGIRYRILAVLAFVFLFSVVAFAQVVPNEEKKPEGLMEVLIDQALQNTLFRAGIFYVQPGLNIFGQYDSNALSLENNPQADYNFQAVPSALIFLPFKSRALLEVDEAVQFIYYNELEDLRGVFNSTRAKFTIGGPRVLFTISDDFHIERIRLTQEFDFPVNQRRNNFYSSFTLGLGERSALEAGFQSSTDRVIEDFVNPTGIPLSDFFDRTENRAFVELRRNVSERTAFVGNVYYENINFAEESVQPDATTWALQGGFSFQARGNITGQALLGYKHLEPDIEGLPDYNGIVGSGSVRVRVGERTTMGIDYIRDAAPSVTAQNWFFIESRIIPSIEYYITRSLSVYGDVGYGKNSYELPGQIVGDNGEPTIGEIMDDSTYADLGFRYKIKNYWNVFVNGNWFSRNSNLTQSEKDRYLISTGISTSFK
ncbi:outer membrane beta-barrel protein [bacterium]|nr:outer membrane beta-barrel protein [bacterium]